MGIQHPQQILEHIFDNSEFKSRRKLTPVCRRCNSVLFSKRFIDRKVFLTVRDTQMLYSKPSLHRNY
ncbi:hypothetical protein ZHAS_00010968 [Anopheles sinensis]|uniref:Uncharacterized protein n=1 Tax=Anopheles sinensis TaxID=74873 RepID=A0A084VYY2_ANOSI|nr:hypothetical protein ZHAS_00010968 [Anopheles sinensis]